MNYRQKPVIFAIDDELVMLSLYKKVLHDVGDVKCFLSAQEFLEFYKDHQPQTVEVIVCDYAMPDINGAQMIEKLKTERRDIPPVLLISGNLDKSRTIESVNSGVRGVLEKPFKNDVLVQQVQHLLFEQKYHIIHKEIFSSLKKMQEVFQIFRILHQDELEMKKASGRLLTDHNNESQTIELLLTDLERRLAELQHEEQSIKDKAPGRAAS